MKLTRTCALLFVVLSGCESGVCVPGETQACVGAGACAGGQFCLASGDGFSACVCDSPNPDASVRPDAGGDAGRDAGEVDAGTDAATPDSGPPDASVDGGPADAGVDGGPDGGFGAFVTVDAGAGPVPANYGCLGSRTVPLGGSAEPVVLEVRDFFSDDVVSELSVHAFANNVVSAGCTGACQARTTNLLGRTAVTVSRGGWSAYRFNAGTAGHIGASEAYATTLVQNAEGPTVGPLTLTAARESSLNTLTAISGIARQPGAALLTGAARDCDGRPVSNAEVRVFTTTDEVAFGTMSSGPRRFYYAGEIPNSLLEGTSDNGLFGAGNLPSGTALRVEVWGRVSDDLERLGCETIEAVPDGFNLLDVGPTRADAPSGC
ncbi:MAG: hypothetical protein AB8I08_04030 [Sandaracinaceae bacterium]